jgi:hypothetical protein
MTQICVARRAHEYSPKLGAVCAQAEAGRTRQQAAIKTLDVLTGNAAKGAANKHGAPGALKITVSRGNHAVKEKFSRIYAPHQMKRKSPPKQSHRPVQPEHC